MSWVDCGNAEKDAFLNGTTCRQSQGLNKNIRIKILYATINGFSIDRYAVYLRLCI